MTVKEISGIKVGLPRIKIKMHGSQLQLQ